MSSQPRCDARVIVDGGPALDPAHRADQHVEPEDDAEREHDQQEGEAVGQPPDRELGDVEAGVVLQQRIGHAVGHALPGERHLLPALRAAGADEQTEQRARADGDARAGCRG